VPRPIFIGLLTLSLIACGESPPPGPAVCPDGLEPRFGSIEPKVIRVSCGVSTTGCHSTEGSVNSGGLDMESDPWLHLLGPDGTGQPANNQEGTVKGLLRVKPGDPDNSFLVIKLSTKTNTSPEYGSGMPFPTPGDVCPETLETIKVWIAAGAQND
jgi:hypothetical protein